VNPNGAWTKISTKTASNSATIDFTSLSSVYRDFMVVASDIVPATDGALLFVRLSNAGSFLAGASDYAWAVNGWGSDNVAITDGDSADSEIQIAGNGAWGSDTAESGSFTLILYNPSGTTNRKKIACSTTYVNSSAITRIVNAAGSIIVNSLAVDGIRILFSTGNIEAGTFSLYGREN
jgi:hypothetical protein